MIAAQVGLNEPLPQTSEVVQGSFGAGQIDVTGLESLKDTQNGLDVRLDDLADVRLKEFAPRCHDRREWHAD
jgi:hypothetical protein